MSEKDPKAKLRSLIDAIRVGMFVTIDDDGLMRSRPMYAQHVDNDDRIYFFTGKDSHKVEELRHEHKVSCAFSNPTKQDYVSVSGSAELSTDRALIDKLWNEMVRVWFPKGKDDPNLAVLVMTPEKGEYWDSPSSTMLHAYGYVKAVLTGKPPAGGENEKVRL